MNKKIKILLFGAIILIAIGIVFLLINGKTPVKKKVKEVKPVIVAKDIEIFQGDELKLDDSIKCMYKKKKIKCSIKGKYDINTAGEYKIDIVATKNKNKIKKTITLKVKEKEIPKEENNAVVNNNDTNKNPYYTEVIRNQNVVIVYGLDRNGNYTKVVKTFVSSVGKDGGTPTGVFTTTNKYVWRALYGGVYGQYATRITGSILFHSVPYTAQSKDSLEWDEYNKLGEAASMGCVRLAVSDVKWIYDNCPSGMTVKIYDGELPSGITKPTSIKIDGNSPNRGWDPTDPDSNNPWK